MLRLEPPDVTSLDVELGGESTYPCPCCGGVSTTLHGYLFDAVGNTAVYFIGYVVGHADRQANLALSVGKWGEGAEPTDRRVFALRASLHGNEVTVAPQPTSDSPWTREAFLGVWTEFADVDERSRGGVLALAKVAIEMDERARHGLSG